MSRRQQTYTLDIIGYAYLGRNEVVQEDLEGLRSAFIEAPQWPRLTVMGLR